MQQPTNQLRKAISGDRIEAYRLSPAETDVDLFTRYLWNTTLSRALYPALQCLEVALRNSLDGAICQVVRPDWLSAQPLLLARSEQDVLKEAVAKLRAERKPLTASRIVAALSFGFWTSLLDVRYEQVLWPFCLKAAFPHMPRRQRTRTNALQALNRIRRLRNRVFHHEPIWRLTDLAQQHAEVLTALGWLNPTLRDVVIAVDDFPQVHQAGPNAYRGIVETALRTPRP